MAPRHPEVTLSDRKSRMMTSYRPSVVPAEREV